MEMGDEDTVEATVVLSSPPFRKRKLFESSTTFSITTKSLFDKLPDQVFEEILQRVPLKLTNICKCVSKHWYALISTPHFARCYVHHRSSLVPPFALFYQVSDRLCAVQLTTKSPIFKSPGFSLNFLPSSYPSPSSPDRIQPEPIRHLASSNGLLLCSASLFFQKIYYVCNPLTMHWVELPSPPTCHEMVVIGFLCKPSDCPSCTSSFRVVRIHVFNPGPWSTNLKLEIFSSDEWKWTETIISTPDGTFVHASTLLVLWLATEYSTG
ncbi:F-box protein At5g49610-like [Cornus florida]|uniref:F-box protein At5g49610-like n=1 Tax=Cornus florida TaxID=4283 RepID=UPI0028990AE2|nr:F-box protein At5g49610-like [Cornus florida]